MNVISSIDNSGLCLCNRDDYIRKGCDGNLREEVKDALLYEQIHVPVDFPLLCDTVHLE